jgi:bifunctional DNA-binding transcriptional regulator/antitoxin component of YhaV-PrlF toxin-antitoxin module
MTTILKATTKGQITLPAKWRKQFYTDQFVATISSNKLEIEPLEIKRKLVSKEYTVFDAIRDNQGRGIRAADLIKVLKKIS